MSEDRLASIVRRDGEWDAEFTGADWRAADVLADRRYLLGLLSEARDVLSQTFDALDGDIINLGGSDEVTRIARFRASLAPLVSHVAPARARAAIAALERRKG